MKTIFKDILYGVLILLIVGFIVNLFKKSAKTRVMLHAYDSAKKTITLAIFTNQKSRLVDVDLSQLSIQSVKANDYRIEIGVAGDIVGFGVYNDRNQKIETHIFSFKTPVLQTIFEEK